MVKKDEFVYLKYMTKIKFKCPKRGWVEEEVEVKRYKSAQPPEEVSTAELELFIKETT